MVSHGRRPTDDSTSDLKIHDDIEIDVVFHSTTEGGYRGYTAVMSQAEQELFLWHVVEIVRANKDRSVMFLDEVKVPTLSFTSLIKLGGFAETSNNEDRGRLFDSNYSASHDYTTRSSKPSGNLCALNWSQPAPTLKRKMVSIATLTDSIHSVASIRRIRLTKIRSNLTNTYTHQTL